ncbi:MAG: hypothetical protein WC378_20400 [Opitutaceae bacterium]|jgi:hypothetical protein
MTTLGLPDPVEGNSGEMDVVVSKAESMLQFWANTLGEAGKL